MVRNEDRSVSTEYWIQYDVETGFFRKEEDNESKKKS